SNPTLSPSIALRRSQFPFLQPENLPNSYKNRPLDFSPEPTRSGCGSLYFAELPPISAPSFCRLLAAVFAVADIWRRVRHRTLRLSRAIFRHSQIQKSPSHLRKQR